MATKKTPPKKKRPKQAEIPGTERPVHPDIREKGEELYEVRSERMELTKREKELGDDLLALMKKHKLTEHREGDLTMKIVAKDERVKVTKSGGEGGDEG